MDISDLIERLRASDSEIFDVAFEDLRRNIETVKTSIYFAAVRERNIHAKGALIELLGESRDAKYVPYIAKQLQSKHGEVIFWAHAALQRIGTSESIELVNGVDIRKMVSEARQVKSR